jgi:predicted RNA-binding Zn-ribbon protein involved in translation (DUF1610 family)
LPKSRLEAVSNSRLNFNQAFETVRYAMSFHETRFPSDRFPVDLPCPNCGRTMQLKRSTADTSGISEVHSYGCAECGLWTAAGSIKGATPNSWTSLMARR